MPLAFRRRAVDEIFPLAATLAIGMMISIGILGVFWFDVSAIAEPGRAESYIDSAGRH
jgi:hypothetical protein